MDPFKKLASYIPGFSGYVERQNRRDADKLVRDTVARRFEELWKRASNLQVDLVNAGKIEYVDDMEKAAIQLRTFIDKISTAARGYSGLFDAVKINEKELEALYNYDLAFFALADQINSGLDNVEASLSDDNALPAAIRNITTLGRQAVQNFDKRSEAFTGSGQ
jgi:nitrate reductase beta subunit